MNKFRKRAKRISAGILILIIVIPTLTFLIGAFTKSILVREYPPPGRMVNVDEFMMHIHCTGEGSPTVILSAGLDDFSIFWSQVQSEIAKSMRVCSYDRAGLGWSEPSPYPRTSEMMVTELHALLVKAKVDPPYVLVGHSFGGALVRLYAHHYPDEVDGMILVDAAPDDLFTRVPSWKGAIAGKLELYRTLAPLSSFGLLALTPESIPNRGMPEDMLAQYRAIAVSTNYFKTGIAENEAFESNLAAMRDINMSLLDKPLFVISRGYWDPIPNFSEIENTFAWQMWQEMQVEFLSLSSNSSHVIAGESEHNIHLQQPELVIDAIRAIAKQ